MNEKTVQTQRPRTDFNFQCALKSTIKCRQPENITKCTYVSGSLPEAEIIVTGVYSNEKIKR